VSISVIVWDEQDDPPEAVEHVLAWRTYAHRNRVTSVPRYLEEHADRLRSKYLAFIHDLSQARIRGKRVVDHLDRGDGFSFWWMTQLAEKSYLKSSRLSCCLRLLALEEILLARQPSALTLVSSDQDLAHAMRRLCHNLQLRFVWQRERQPPQKWSLRRLYRALPWRVQGLISLARHLVARWPLRRIGQTPWFSGDRAVFLCSYFINLDPGSGAEGRFYSEYWAALPKYLHDSGRRTNWIHHFRLSPMVPDARTGARWLRLFNRDASNQGYHAFIDTYLTLGIVVRVLRDWCWLNALAWRLRSIHEAFRPQESAVWLWPILRGDWWDSLVGPLAISNCLWVALFDAALGDMPRQSLGLYLCENQGWERALLRAWRKHGHGQIVGVLHATVAFWHLYNFDDPRSLSAEQTCRMPLPDRLAVNGGMAVKAFSAVDYPLARLVEVEALRYLSLSGITPKRESRSEKPDATTPPKPEPSRVNVLILGDMIPAAMHTFLRLLEDTVKLLPPVYRFTFKPHPGLSVDLTRYPGLRAGETRETLDRILDEYDVAVSANSTSAAVDAYQVGVPVIVMLDGDDLNLSPLRGQPGVRFVSTRAEFVDALQTAGNEPAPGVKHEELFFLDPALTRWKRLLSPVSSA
jgi:surface carbohydrate biosynthesis protein (TIGR04326 family)